MLFENSVRSKPERNQVTNFMQKERKLLGLSILHFRKVLKYTYFIALTRTLANGCGGVLGRTYDTCPGSSFDMNRPVPFPVYKENLTSKFWYKIRYFFYYRI